jgi:hypothetical protein
MFRNILNGCLLLLISFTSAKADLSAPDLMPMFWPQDRLIPIQTSQRIIKADGIEISIVELRNSALPMYSASFNHWSLASKLTFRNASIAFHTDRDSSIRMGLSLIKARDWLGELNEDTLKRYVLSLEKTNPGKFQLLNPNTHFDPISGSGLLVGNPYKQIHYEITDAAEPGKVIEVWDFIAQEKDLLVVLSFECPRQVSSRYQGTPEILLSSISTMEDFE